MLFQNNNGRTCLMNAIRKVSVVTLLTEHGANIDLQDKNGNTALHHAVCQCGFPLGVVNHLVTLGASLMCNNRGLERMSDSRGTSTDRR